MSGVVHGLAGAVVRARGRGADGLEKEQNLTHANQMAMALRAALTPWMGRAVTLRVAPEDARHVVTLTTGTVQSVARWGVVLRTPRGYRQFWSWPDWITGVVHPADEALAAAVRTIREASAVPVAPADPAAFLRRLAADTSTAATLRVLRAGAGF